MRRTTRRRTIGTLVRRRIHPARTKATIPPPASGNYITNPTFTGDTNNDGVANGWLEEHSTPTAATYTLTPGTLGAGQGERMVYAADGVSTGKKVEFYQATAVGTFAEGEPATFTVWLSGSVTNGYATIVIESHTGSTYLAEVNQIVQLTATPQPFRVTYPAMPAGTDCAVVVVQVPELGATTACDITAQAPELAKAVKPALVRRLNYMTNPSFEAGTTLATGYTEANSIAGTVTYALSTTSPGYGAKKQTATYASTADTNKQVQIISPTTASGTFAPGDVATFSLLVSGTLGGCSMFLRIQWMTSAGGSAGTVDTAALAVTATPTRFALTATAPALTASARILIRVTAISTGRAFDLAWDGALLEKAGTAGSYFDGDTPGFQWLGAAHASQSSQLLTYPLAA